MLAAQMMYNHRSDRSLSFFLDDAQICATDCEGFEIEYSKSTNLGVSGSKSLAMFLPRLQGKNIAKLLPKTAHVFQVDLEENLSSKLEDSRRA